MEKWAVVAVDQFTSEPEYWKKAENFVGNAPSTLKLVLPEVYLGTEEESKKNDIISASMASYPTDVLTKETNGFIVVKRTHDGLTRTGVVLALDLEKYSFVPGSGANIAATEKTVLERIPPRVAIRRTATVELPHVLILINDPNNNCIKELEKAASDTLYDFDLMQCGGHIKGLAVTDNDAIEKFNESISKILPMAVGDGNHSFAAAKAYWEELKANGAESDHPARFALCEIENVFDDGIVFEPIHRVVFDYDFDAFVDELSDYFGENAGFAEDLDVKFEEPNDDNANYHIIKLIADGRSGNLYVDKKYAPLAVSAIQSFIESKKDIKVDYVHNLSNTVGLLKGGNIGILLPKMPKSELFNVVKRGEVLPKKTFSMGVAESKRYYLEARKIRKD